MNFMTFHILRMSSSQLTFIFFRGVEFMCACKSTFFAASKPIFAEIHLDPQLRKSRPVSPAVGVAAHAVAAPSRRRLPKKKCLE